MNATVLVSGVGAVTGYGVLRSLRGHDSALRLVGTDIHSHAVGFSWSDTALVSPPVSDEAFPDWLCEAVQQSGAQLVLPTLEAELTLFHEHPDLVARVNDLGCRVALPGDRAVSVSRDKWRLHQLLIDHDDPAAIPTMLPADFDTLRRELGAPFIVKPRAGYGSRGFSIVATADELARADDPLTPMIAQQLVGDADSEFTVAVFGDGDGGILARVVLRRWLAPEGMTMRATSEPVPPRLDFALERLTALLRPFGAINLQLREHDDDYRLLEVNARVSSSTSLRTRFGYNEAGMLVDLHLHGRHPEQPTIRLGTAVRFLDDSVTFR